MKELRRSKKEAFMHGDNLRDYEEMHKTRAREMEAEKARISAYMRSKPYGTRKEGA